MLSSQGIGLAEEKKFSAGQKDTLTGWIDPTEKRGPEVLIEREARGRQEGRQEEAEESTGAQEMDVKNFHGSEGPGSNGLSERKQERVSYGAKRRAPLAIEKPGNDTRRTRRDSHGTLEQLAREALLPRCPGFV